MERKLQLKRQFDQQYDGGEGGEGTSFYDDLRKEVDDQANVRISELSIFIYINLFIYIYLSICIYIPVVEPE